MNTLRSLLLLALLIFGSCKDDSITNSDQTDPTVTAFVSKYNFHKIQPIETYLNIKEQSIVGFGINFGEPYNDPAGTMYSFAYGLKSGEKIGWLTMVDSTYFDFDSTDTYLFSVDFWSKLDQSQVWVYRAAFLPLLIRDKDTPTYALQRIAKGLETYIQAQLGYLLLDNAKAKIDLTTLTTLANLPPIGGDVYDPIRSKAKELIKKIGG